MSRQEERQDDELTRRFKTALRKVQWTYNQPAVSRKNDHLTYQIYACQHTYKEHTNARR